VRNLARKESNGFQKPSPLSVGSMGWGYPKHKRNNSSQEMAPKRLAGRTSQSSNPNNPKS